EVRDLHAVERDLSVWERVPGAGVLDTDVVGAGDAARDPQTQDDGQNSHRAILRRHALPDRRGKPGREAAWYVHGAAMRIACHRSPLQNRDVDTRDRDVRLAGRLDAKLAAGYPFNVPRVRDRTVSSRR